MSRKNRVLALLLSVCMLAVSAFSAHAAEWPEKPITVVVPYSAGGDGDLSARLWAEYAEKLLGQTVLVVNKTGGGGVTGTSFAAAAKPDGYTLFLAQAGPVLLTPNVAKTTYSFDSFEYISRMSVGNCALFVNAKESWNTLGEFIEAAKAEPNKYSFASPGATSWLSFAMREFIKKSGIPVKHVEFQGAAPAATAVLGGHTTFSFAFPQNYLPQTKAGQFKVLAIGEKSEQLPDAKTFEEQGFPGSYYGWAGIAAPKGVAPEIKAKLAKATADMVKDPSFIEKANNINATPSYLDEAAWMPVLQEQNTSLAELLKGLELNKK
ncbi:tripartite tricarboxylate transporter substrate binding protein [Desulfovibrio sp. OttesenSCG-928-G15]|nr:tripartite tricarboxylate transporter substrate binding protein [Desulfovibrio sp. OttesenSCG-928-G15]